MYKILILLCPLLLYTSVDILRKTPLIVGVNGHPFNQSDYQNLPIDEQLSLIKELNLNSYRIDINPFSNGEVRDRLKFFELVQKATKNGIKLLPMIYLTGFDFQLSNDECFRRGFNLGFGFGSKYGKYFEHYELGNELELQKEISSTSKSGSDEKDYYLPNMKKLAAFLKGMNDGLKKTDPNSKTIINCAGWFHFVYLELLQKLGVNFDIAGYHWYSDMDDYAKSVNVDILSTLSIRLKKPIWFTEINYISSSFNSSSFEEKRKDWTVKFIKQCETSDLIEAVFIYELIDEPNLQTAHESEKRFGLVKRKLLATKTTINNLSKNGNWILKETANALKGKANILIPR